MLNHKLNRILFDIEYTALQKKYGFYSSWLEFDLLIQNFAIFWMNFVNLYKHKIANTDDDGVYARPVAVYTSMLFLSMFCTSTIQHSKYKIYNSIQTLLYTLYFDPKHNILIELYIAWTNMPYEIFSGFCCCINLAKSASHSFLFVWMHFMSLLPIKNDFFLNRDATLLFCIIVKVQCVSACRYCISPDFTQ